MMILKAVQFAGKKHEGQKRRGTGLPYVIHPVTVAFILAEHKESKKIEELLAACCLHDTLEDTDTTFEELAKEFSPLVASLVLELTSDPEQIKVMGKNEYLINKMLGMSNYALVIKLADRYSNVLDNPSDKYIEDTKVMLNVIKVKRMLTASQKSLLDKMEELLYPTEAV
jgi:guanosine-3',5'-bis(diphosphate) 3'-pyrophosphohydrolase